MVDIKKLQTFLNSEMASGAQPNDLHDLCHDLRNKIDYLQFSRRMMEVPTYAPLYEKTLKNASVTHKRLLGTQEELVKLSEQHTRSLHKKPE
jgi:hypothetical protein